MTVLRRFYYRIKPTVRARVFIYLALTAALIFAAFVLRGGQPATYMMAVRRAEQAELMGPGEVIRVIDLDGRAEEQYKRIYVLRESDCMALAVASRQSFSGLVLRYTDTDAALIPVEMRDGAALGSVSRYVGNGLNEPKYIFAFDDYPQAVRAELTAAYDESGLTLNWYAPSESGELTHFNETGDVHLVYTAQAEREDEGMFIFSFDAKDREGASFTGQAEERLFMETAWYGFYYGEDMAGRRGLEISISFYDASGNLIAEESALWGI